MRECRDCGGTISRSAKTCPHCGADKPNRGKVEQGFHELANGVMALGVLLILGSCVAMVFA